MGKQNKVLMNGSNTTRVVMALNKMRAGNEYRHNLLYGKNVVVATAVYFQQKQHNSSTSSVMNYEE